MQKFKRIMRVCGFYAIAVLIAGGYPLAALAAEPTYTYDPATGRWNTDKWQYNNETGIYEEKPAPVPPVVEQPSLLAQASVSEPSGESVNSLNSNTSDADITIQTNNSSTAQTGNASVTQNTTAGNATTGNAAASTTIVNTIHSTVGGDTVGIAHFTSDIYGNVTGDITLSSAIDGVASPPSDQKLTADNSVTVTNTVSVDAKSGEASVAQNTTAGNATSGSANAVANVINLINSIIAANKSFVGTINIYGNLNGDILVSPDFIPQLIASNSEGSATSVESNNTQSIINNVYLQATSGSADVSKNTTAGQATTGNASTNLTILNLSGRQVTASNSLLVFVNVLGTWVGIIVDAPQGATAAALGSGVTENKGGQNTQITANNENQIINDINVTATSGNASVTQNTTAGNATTGNATASANILNVTMSNFSLSDWFGILFINVYGHWDGSFGVNTASGDLPVVPAPVATNPAQTTPPFSLGFIPRSTKSQQVARSITPTYSEDAVTYDESGPEVLGTATTNTVMQQQTPKIMQAEVQSNPFFIILAAILLTSGLAATTFAVVRHRKLA